MTKASDFFVFVESIGSNLDTSDGDHLLEVFEKLGFRGLGMGGKRSGGEFMVFSRGEAMGDS